MNGNDIGGGIVFAIFSVALFIAFLFELHNDNSKRNRQLRIFFGMSSAICFFASLSIIFGNPSEW
tara:strand:- start:6402 stop:6596 length:195 start_codon:yes stop_codon:yes gene_type:complete